MKPALPFLGALLLALFTSSCIEHVTTVRLNKDGSGTVTEETLFSAEASAMMADMPGGGQDPSAQFSDKAKAEEAAAKMGEGVTVEKAEKINKDGRVGGRVVYKFKDINTLKLEFGSAVSDAGDGLVPSGEAEATKESDPITFNYKDGVLTLSNPGAKEGAAVKKPAAADANGDGAAEDDASDPQALAMMQQMFKDMRLTLNIEIADGIAESNATHVEGNVVTLIDMPFGKLIADPENLKKLEALGDATPTETAAAFKDIAGLKIETKDEVTVKVK